MTNPIGLPRRRALAAGAGLGAAALLGRGAEAAGRSCVAFGDSYTRSYRAGVPTYADQLHASGAVNVLVNLATSGATAVGTNTMRTLDGQIDVWLRSYRSLGLPERAVIYIGNNDVAGTATLYGAMTQLRAQVDRLIAQGLNQGTRRIVLCLIHDWSRNPASTRSVRSRVRSWNQFQVSLAAARPNVVTVPIYTRIERVFANPAAYGITNLTEPNRALSATTHLYLDGHHFGRKGHAILANEIRPFVL